MNSVATFLRTSGVKKLIESLIFESIGERSDIRDCCHNIIRVEVAVVSARFAAFTDAGTHPLAFVDAPKNLADVVIVARSLLDREVLPLTRLWS